MAKISSITAREILDSRGNPTIETTVVLDDGSIGIAGVPSGASTGSHEAIELRDHDSSRYNGLGVLTAINNVNTILSRQLISLDPCEQGKIDQLMISLDGTDNKAKLGANSILSISIAVSIAASQSLRLPYYRHVASLSQKLGATSKPLAIPTPTFNIINGGKHGTGNLDFQEFHVVPAQSKPYYEALQIGSEVYHSLKEILIAKDAIHSVGDEGGFTPNLNSNLDACEILVEAIKKTPYQNGSDVFCGLDLAPNNFFVNGHYQIKDKPNPLSTDDFVEYLIDLNNRFYLVYMEDPLSEDDWEGWKKITHALGRKTTIIGDDLLVTNPRRLKRAIEEKACTGILVKPNQIGTLTEMQQVVKIAQDAGFKTMISHRSGETNDDYIADIAVGVGADFVKFGAPARGERVAKYNRLLVIEEELSQTDH